VLARDKRIDQVSRTLSAVPGASEDLVTLTAGALLARSGEHDRAAARLARLVDDHSAPDYLRGRAGLLRAGSLATDGQTEQAIRQLKQIESIDVWRAEAILAHARLLYSAGQRAAAGRRLNELLEQAGQKEDAKTLRRLAQLALAVRETGIALAAAEQVARIDAKDPQSHLQLARVHLVRGDVEKLEAACRAAVAARPGSIRAQLALAEALDYQAKRAEALGVLEEMEPQGRANRTASLLEQGALLRRWGLIQPAMERYAQLEELGYGRSPRLQLALGRMYFVLGREDKARQTLLRVPKYAPQFIPARQLIAEMADTPTEKLDALAELAKTHPDEPALTMHRMSVLVQSRQSKDAAAAFETLMDSPHGASVSGSAAMVAVRAMVDANQLDQARTTCMQMVERSPRPEWRYLSILLAMEDKPVLASELLKKARRPGQADVLLGLAMGGLADDPNQVGRWWKQFETIRDGGRPEGSRFSPQAVLAALVGKPDYGTELAETFDSPATYREWIARELAQATRAGQADRGEAAALLRGELARGLGLPQAARKWAMEVLRARPSSQWAAALAFHTSSEPSQRRRVVQLLRPAKAPLAVQLRASLLVEEGKFAQAAELYRQLAKSHPKQVDLRMGHASAVESAGELAEAMELYQDVWEELGHGLAANNAAYLMAVLHPKDTARLEKAWGLARKTVETYPRAPAFLDTAGWLAHLRGDHRQAIVYLTRAVKGWPKVPDIHYHLGMAERAGGSKRLGEWHLRAAVELGRRLGEQGTPLSSQTQQAVLRAEQELK
jgi:tetratricopeptide (TPR) repeat protein